MMAVEGAMYHADEVRARALLTLIDDLCDGNDPIDIVAATRSVLCHAVAIISKGSLEAALLNVDALALDMKSLLRERLGH